MDSLDYEILKGLFRVFLLLVVLAPAIYALTRWYGKRYVGSQSIKIKESASLGPNRGLYVVEWEGRRMLLGVSPQRVEVLYTLPIADSPLEEVVPE